MSCKNVCKLCDKIVVSQSVTYSSGVLTINIPEDRCYANGATCCLVIAQAIPDTAIINAPVVITIGTSPTTYPLVTKCCQQVVAAGIRTRTRYKTRVVTNATGGYFRMIGNPCCTPNNNRRSLN